MSCRAKVLTEIDAAAALVSWGSLGELLRAPAHAAQRFQGRGVLVLEPQQSLVLVQRAGLTSPFLLVWDADGYGFIGTGWLWDWDKRRVVQKEDVHLRLVQSCELSARERGLVGVPFAARFQLRPGRSNASREEREALTAVILGVEQSTGEALHGSSADAVVGAAAT